jgi:hypothetical protein
VTANRQKIAAQIADAKRATAGGLRRVDMKQRSRARDRLGHRRYILDRADLRVGEANRHQSRIIAERRCHRGRRDSSVANWRGAQLAPYPAIFERRENRRMLDRRGYDPVPCRMRAGYAANRKLFDSVPLLVNTTSRAAV